MPSRVNVSLLKVLFSRCQLIGSEDGTGRLLLVSLGVGMNLRYASLECDIDGNIKKFFRSWRERSIYTHMREQLVITSEIDKL